MYIKQILLKL